MYSKYSQTTYCIRVLRSDIRRFLQLIIDEAGFQLFVEIIIIRSIVLIKMKFDIRAHFRKFRDVQFEFYLIYPVDGISHCVIELKRCRSKLKGVYKELMAILLLDKFYIGN